MAGTAEADNQTGTLEARVPDVPSLPLYLAGLIVTLCGILAASSALTTPDYGWMGRTILLAGLGFLLSYGARRRGLKPQALDFGFAAALGLGLVAVTTGQINLEQFLPLGADNPGLRLMSGLVWGATVWAWALRDDNRVMLTTVPAMAVLGLAASIDLNDPVLACFGVFILTVIFLLIHQNFLQNRARARSDAGGPVLPDAARRLLPAQLAQTGLCALAVLGIGLVVIVPAQVVFSHLSLAQAIRQLAAVNKADKPGVTPALHFSDDDNLSIGTGTAWSASADVVMRVTPSDGQPHYWRGRTYDQYTGAGWQSSLENQHTEVVRGDPGDSPTRLSYFVGATPTPGDVPAPPSAPTLSATFQAKGDTEQFYYAPASSRIQFGTAFAHDGRYPNVCRDGRLDLSDHGPVRFPYTVISSPAPDSAVPAVQDRLRAAGTDYPADVRHLYLDPRPNDITTTDDLAFYRQAAGEAVSGLPPDRRDPLDEALAIRDWVSRRCVYSLSPPPIPDRADHVRAFLDTNRLGYCDLFASSLAVLCRASGIPARLATGFAPGDPDGDGFNLRAEDKHAWTEVYFPRAGWVALDATQGSTSDGTVPRGQTTRRGWLSGLRGALAGGGAFVTPLVLVVLAIVGYVLKTEVWDRRRPARVPALRESPQRTALGRRYARMTRALARMGLPRRASETPAEFAARAAAFLAAQGVSAAPGLIAGLSGEFAQACYGGSAAPEDDGARWDTALSALLAASRRAFWRRLLRMGLSGRGRTAQPS